ncbi:MAG TPA: radical SAM family heme chaperone HemW [Halanaerobiales bacterium]|nr:radical SAM family heme chaperone HemW [Halanaerobiales bacterium]
MVFSKKHDFLGEITQPFALYIHIPFCIEKCSYCDFYSLKYKKKILKDYLKSLKKELKIYSTKIDSKIKTIYFGGGTPSLLSPKSIEEILNIIYENYLVIDNIEISLESNPSSLTKEKIIAYKKVGINRLSLGIQSFNNDDLNILGRLHDRKKALSMIKEVDKQFSNYNFDLIFAIPEQNFERWKANINKVKEINPPHLSLYNLQIEEGTMIKKQIDNNNLKPVTNELDAKMYKHAIDKLKDEDYIQYEISNFAKKGYFSKHNLVYWRYEPYLGLGPSAHSFTTKTRFSNYSSLEKYNNHLKKDKVPIENINSLNLQERMSEKMFLGLRLKEGINYEQFHSTFNKKLNCVFKEEINDLLEKDLLIEKDNNLKLSQKGKFLGNKVFIKFV